MRCGTAHIVCGDGREMSLDPGDVFYLPIGLSYHSYWYGDEQNDNHVEWDTVAFTHLSELTGRRYAMQVIHTDEAGLSLLEQLLGTPFEPVRTSGLLYLFLAHALPTMQPDVGDVQGARLEHIKTYMAQHLDESVEEVARHCNVSPSALYQLFREKAGMSTTEWKHQVRVERALMLLRSTDLSVEQISEQTGFCSAGYFRRIVKERTGCSPRELRRRRDLDWNV
jgi:AraC-like DNA-binding protein